MAVAVAVAVAGAGAGAVAVVVAVAGAGAGAVAGAGVGAVAGDVMVMIYYFGYSSEWLIRPSACRIIGSNFPLLSHLNGFISTLFAPKLTAMSRGQETEPF